MRIKKGTMHRGAALAWAILAIPTVFWWRESVLWVALISVYANVISHWGAAEACDASDAATEANQG